MIKRNEKMTEAIDIYSKGEYPADRLSNFYPHEFVFDGISCASMEGFLQSLKYRSSSKQSEVCRLAGKAAKEAGAHKLLWRITGRVYWQGKAFRRHRPEFTALLTRAYQALYAQNADFRDALTASAGKTLMHTLGKHNPRATILTEEEFIAILNELRDYSIIKG